MTGTKVLLIVLILMVVLFVVFVYWGTGQDKTIPADPNTAVAKAPPFMDTLNGMLSPFSPKLQPKQLQPPLTTFDLRSAAHYAAKILPDSDHKFRQAKFIVRPNKACALVSYAALGDVPGKMPNPQKSSDDHKKSSNEFTLTIFGEGGTLTVDRALPFQAGPCEVVLQ